MSFKGKFIAAIAVMTLAAAVSAAEPISGCNFTGFTCNFYETDSQGNPSETGGMVSVPSFGLLPHDVVLFESSGGSILDRTTWSDALHFTASLDPSGMLAIRAQLLSEGCNCFASLDIGANPTGVTETQTGQGSDFTDFTSFAFNSFQTINVFSDAPIGEPVDSQVPEPTTFAIVGAGMAVLVAARRRIRRRQARQSFFR
jgi:hypothetical protein